MPGVAYSPDFWIAAAAGAPVIALANTVVMIDAAPLRLKALLLKDDDTSAPISRSVGSVIWPMIASSLSYLAQTVALNLSLASLAKGRNEGPVGLVTDFEVYGLLVLMLISVNLGHDRIVTFTRNSGPPDPVPGNNPAAGSSEPRLG